MVSRRYGHLAKDDVTSVVHDAAGKLLSHGGIMGDNTPKDIERND